VLTVLHWMLRDPEIEREPGVVRAQPGGGKNLCERNVAKLDLVAIVQRLAVTSSAKMNLGG
jgi:hypothetical protein